MAYQFCPRCGTPRDAGARFCTTCGFAIGPVAAVSPDVTPSSATAEPAAPQASIASPLPDAGPPSERARRSRAGVVALVVVASAAVLLTVAFLLGRVTNGPSPASSSLAALPASPTAAASAAPEPSQMPSPSISLTPPPAATITPRPTSASAQPVTSVTLRVVHCPATYGGMGALPAPPPTWDVALPSDVALAFSFYGISETRVLAPRGWECSGLVGADGSYGITIADPTDAHAAVSVDGAPGAPYGEVLSMACPFFSDASKKARADFPGMFTCSVPAGEKVLRIDSTDIEFIDAPGIAGTGALSGLAYPVYGIVHYDSGGGASTLSCALPPSSPSLCKPILDTFVANPF